MKTVRDFNRNSLFLFFFSIKYKNVVSLFFWPVSQPYLAVSRTRIRIVPCLHWYPRQNAIPWYHSFAVHENHYLSYPNHIFTSIISSKQYMEKIFLKKRKKETPY